MKLRFVTETKIIKNQNQATIVRTSHAILFSNGEIGFAQFLVSTVSTLEKKIIFTAFA